MNGLDLSQFSNQQLQALAKGDYSSLSNEQLQQLSQWHDQQVAQQQAQQQPTQPGAVQQAIAPVFGAGAAVAGAAATVPGAIVHAIKENPGMAAVGSVLFGDQIKQGIANYIKDPAIRAAQSIKDIALQGLKGGTQAAANAARNVGSIAPESLGLGSISEAASAIAPYVRGATAGLTLGLHSEDLNSGEDAQVAATRAQYPQYYGQPQTQPSQPQPNGGMQ